MADAAVLSILINAKDNASAALKQAEGSTSSLTSKLGMLAGALVAAGGAYVSLNTIKGAIDDTQQLGDATLALQRVTGDTAQQSSDMLFAFKETGVDADQASTMLGRFTKNMFAIQVANEDGSAPNKTTAQLLKDIGVSALDANGKMKPTSDLLSELADKFAAMPDGPQKTATAIALFGKSGIAMIPFLDKGSAGLAEMSAEAKKLGLELSGDNVNQIHAYTVEQRTMSEAIEGLKVKIGIALMPQLTKLMTWFVSVQPKIQEFLTNGIAAIRKGIADVQPVIAKIVEIFGGPFTDGLKTIGQIIVNDVVPAVRLLIQWFESHKAAMIALGVAIAVAVATFATIPAAILLVILAIGYLSEHWDAIKAKTLEVWNAISDFLNEKLGFLRGVFDAGWNLIKTIVINRLDEIKVYFETQLKVLEDIFKFFSAIFHGDWQAAWDAIKQLVSDVLTGIEKILGDELGIFAALMSFAWEAIKAQASIEWTALKDVITWILGLIWAEMKAFPGQILDAIGDLGALLFDKGKALIQGLINGIASLDVAGAINDQLKKIPGVSGAEHLIGRAGGGWASGLTLVGERGPELVNLPGGSYVHSNAESQQMGGHHLTIYGGTININPQTLSGNDIFAALEARG